MAYRVVGVIGRRSKSARLIVIVTIQRSYTGANSAVLPGEKIIKASTIIVYRNQERCQQRMKTTLARSTGIHLALPSRRIDLFMNGLMPKNSVSLPISPT